LSLEFPTEYHNDVLAGAAVEFDITLNSVSVQVLPEVNEEFYKSFGVEEGGVAAFREEVSNNMRREMKTASRNKLKTKVMDALVAAVDVTVPESLVSNEILQLKNQALQQMGGAQGADPSMLPDELFKEQADRRVVLGLVLGEIIGEQNLQADPAKVRESVEELAATYESPDDVINWYYGNKEQLATIESAVVEDQVFDYIIEESVVTDTEVSYQEIIKPEPREDASSEDDDIGSDNTESES
jgi:trigger factor